MSKELEALECFENMQSRIACYISTIEYTTIKEALVEYEAIKDTEPSEALEWFGEQWVEYGNQDTVMQIKDTKEFATIKQALLKAQKEHNSINLLMQELDCKDFVELRKYARCGYEKLNKKDLHLERVEE